MTAASSVNTYLGFDYGKKRIGVATGQEFTRTATRLTSVVNHGEQLNWEQIGTIIQEWNPDALVVGVPLHMDGQDNEITAEVKMFCQELQQRYNLPVYTEDERLSSYAAEALMKEKNIDPYKNKHLLDEFAAQLILQSWLDKPEATRFAETSLSKT